MDGFLNDFLFVTEFSLLSFSFILLRMWFTDLPKKLREISIFRGVAKTDNQDSKRFEKNIIFFFLFSPNG